MYALNEISKETAATFYIKLLENNFYEKEKTGKRKLYGLGSNNGCIAFGYIYGSALAQNLGWLGDKRAIPVLQEALKQGDYEVRKQAVKALYNLENISLQELFEMAKQEKEVDVAEIIMSVGWENIHSKTEFAIEIFDQIIRDFPNDKYKTASAHFWKIQCYELLQMFDKALLECEEVLKFPEFENLTKQVEERKRFWQN